MSALDVIGAATAKRKAATMCLDGALQAEWDAALAAVDDAAAADGNSGSLALPATSAAFEHLDSLGEKMEASKVTFLFDAANLAWTEYLGLQAQHPPREGNMLDRMRGFNVDTFYPVLIRATCGTVSSAGSEPETMTEDAWAVLLGQPATEEKPATRGSLNLKQVNDLIAAANYVMNGENAVPPSARSLLESQDFGASLALPSPGASLPDASEDGSPSGTTSSTESPTTSTPGDESAPLAASSA